MNKYQKSLDYIKYLFIPDTELAKPFYKNTKEALNDLKELIDKETPKKPHFEGDGYANGELVYDTWVCPNCDEHYEVEFDRYEYCPKCGQRLEWGEDE